MGVEEKEDPAMAIAAALNEDVAVYEDEYRDWCVKLAKGEIDVNKEIQDAIDFGEACGCIEELKELGKEELAETLKKKLEEIAPRIARRCDEYYGHEDSECDAELWACARPEILRYSRNPEAIKRNIKECERAAEAEHEIEGFLDNEMWMLEWG